MCLYFITCFNIWITLFQAQYQFVHDAVKQYILQNETYSNFVITSQD